MVALSAAPKSGSDTVIPGNGDTLALSLTARVAAVPESVGTVSRAVAVTVVEVTTGATTPFAIVREKPVRTVLAGLTW